MSSSNDHLRVAREQPRNLNTTPIDNVRVGHDSLTKVNLDITSESRQVRRVKEEMGGKMKW